MASDSLMQNKIRFVFGNLTKGYVQVKGNNFIYTYDYLGTLVTEMWIYINETTYKYIVGIYSNNTWQQKFLETKFKVFKKAKQ